MLSWLALRLSTKPGSPDSGSGFLKLGFLKHGVGCRFYRIISTSQVAFYPFNQSRFYLLIDLNEAAFCPLSVVKWQST